MDHSVKEILITNAPASISIVACLCFIFTYIASDLKTLGLRMILALITANMIFHIGSIVEFWANESIIQETSVIVLNSALKFSVFWASNIVHCLYRVLTMRKRFESDKYFFLSLMLVMVMSICLTSLCEFVVSQYAMIDMSIMALILLTSVTLTIIYTLKSLAIIKRYSSSASLSSNKTTKALYLYAFVQFITVGPTIAYSYYYDSTNHQVPVAKDIVKILVGFSGLANSFVYFIQRVKTERPRLREAETIDTSRNIRSESLEEALVLEAYSYV